AVAMESQMQPSHPSDIESRIQAAAERAEALPALPPEDIEAYRQVYRAIRAAPLPEMPADFARSMEQMTRDHAEQAMPEIWITRVAMFTVLAGIAASIPALGGVAAAFAGTAQALPWSTALAAALALAVAAMVDRVAGRSE
ncbi:MAG TPA: hypothetical protein VFG21_06690, partial [Xanthomonadaceae bacterium]|nr:hypothetical protein [Xanthomonadaceae bacterium]